MKKMLVRRLGTAGALTVFLMFGAPTANASSLLTDTVTGQVLFGAVTAQGPTNAVVGAGVEFDFGNVDIDVSAEGVRYFNIFGGTVNENETYLLTDLDWLPTPDTVFGVSLVSFAGLSVAPTLGFGPDSVFVTLASGTVVSGGNEIVVSINHSTVPEPATLALLSIGLLGVAAVRRRKTV